MIGAKLSVGDRRVAPPEPSRLSGSPEGWLPRGKAAAVCFSVDDIHPSTSDDLYEAGGDLGRGSLGRLARLLECHPQLQATLFVTPDWRPLWLHPTRTLRARIPFLNGKIHLAAVRPKGEMRIDRFPQFVRYLNGLPRVEVGVHGLHHLHTGHRLTVEFQEQDRTECLAMLREALAIFDAAAIEYVLGFQPPGWNLPDSLVEALDELGFSYVSAARDLTTPVHREAVTSGSGFRGFPLILPEFARDKRLLHFTHNFQATSPMQRAFQVIECGGLLAIKAHIFKAGGGHSMRDGLDDDYCTFLDRLFVELDRCYGECLWWTSFGQIAHQVLRVQRNHPPST